MVTKIKSWLKALGRGLEWDDFGIGFLVGFTCMLSLLAGGCMQKEKPPKSTAKAIPAVVQSYEVPIADTSSIPDLLCLLPGQSAQLLEDAVVVARIPYNGRELYVGEVKIEKGTMLVKPIVE